MKLLLEHLSERVRHSLDFLSTVAVLAAAGSLVWMVATRPAPVPRRPIQPPQEPLPISGLPRLGSDAARVAMIEFSDFECQFCARFVEETLPIIKRDYIENGNVQLVFRHLPLPFHARAQAAAEAAECASRQGLFWPMHDLLFSNPGRLADTDFVRYATSADINATALSSCIREGSATSLVAEDRRVATAIGLTGTPSFVLGLLQDGVVTATHVLEGARPIDTFTDILDDLLSRSRGQS